MSAKQLPSPFTVLGVRGQSSEPDADLLTRFVSAGDQAAFAELVRRYARLVWRVARTRCRTEDTAEDVFQAAFVVLFRKAALIHSGGALAGWLHLTTHRLAVRAARKERPTVPLAHDPPTSADPLDALTARELLTAVDDELARLSDTERTVLVLCGIDGLANDEAARRLGWTSGAVKGRLERARAKLRTRLDVRGLTAPVVLVGIVGSSPSAAAVQAVLRIASGTVSPAVERLVTEVLTMKCPVIKAITVLAVITLTAGGFVGRSPTPHATAAPVPKALKKPAEAWGEERGGLQAGLRMPAGATIVSGKQAEVLVVVRNVGKQAVEVNYIQQNNHFLVVGDTREGRVELTPRAKITSDTVVPRTVTLAPGEELVRWRIPLQRAGTGVVAEPAVGIPAGPNRLVMNWINGAVIPVTDRGEVADFDRLGTGTLEVTVR